MIENERALTNLASILSVPNSALRSSARRIWRCRCPAATHRQTPRGGHSRDRRHARGLSRCRCPGGSNPQRPGGCGQPRRRWVSDRSYRRRYRCGTAGTGWATGDSHSRRRPIGAGRFRPSWQPQRRDGSQTGAHSASDRPVRSGRRNRTLAVGACTARCQHSSALPLRLWCRCCAIRFLNSVTTLLWHDQFGIRAV